MKKKNLLAILCALLLVIGIFTGCAAQTTTASPETEDAAKTEDVTKTENTVETEASTADSSKPLAGKKIGFAHLTLFDEWCVSVARMPCWELFRTALLFSLALYGWQAW